jgi:hypothetical protein
MIGAGPWLLVLVLVGVVLWSLRSRGTTFDVTNVLLAGATLGL